MNFLLLLLSENAIAISASVLSLIASAITFFYTKKSSSKKQNKHNKLRIQYGDKCIELDVNDNETLESIVKKISSDTNEEKK